MKTPSVSVLMTAYNREKYIAEAIESVLAQTYTDFELIIVDDCSKDRTVEIARRYTTDPRVRVYVNEKNLGDYPNRNRAAELALGRYLKYVDADDVIYPHGLEVMVRGMERWPEAAFGICQPDNRIDLRPYPLQLSPAEAYRWHFLKGGLFGNAPLSAIIRAESFRAVGGFTGKRHVGDTEMWLLLGARFPVVILPPGLTWWRSHEEQEHRYAAKKIETVCARHHVALAALNPNHCPLSATERNEAVRRLTRGHARTILRTALNGHAGDAWRVFRGSSLTIWDMAKAFSAPEKTVPG